MKLTPYSSQAVLELLFSYAAALRTEPMLYDARGLPLVKTRVTPSPKSYPLGGTPLTGASVKRRLRGALDLRRLRCIKDCVRTQDACVRYYVDRPDECIVELFAPVWIGAPSDGTHSPAVSAVLASGPLLVDPPGLQNGAISCIPRRLLDKRLELTVEVAACVAAITGVGERSKSAHEAIHAIGRAAIGREGSSRKILKTALAHLVPLVHGDTGSALMLDEEGEELSHVEALPLAISYRKVKKLNLRKGQGICWHAVRLHHSQRAGDVRGVKQYVPRYRQTRSELVCPLVHGNRVLGVMDIEAQRRDAFTPEDEATADMLARVTATALVNRELSRDDELIRRVAKALASAATPHAKLTTAVKAITEATRARLCYLFLREPGDQEVYLRAASRGWGHLVGKLHYKPGEGFTGNVLKRGRECLLNRPRKGRRWKGKYIRVWNERTKNAPVRSLAAAPLIYRRTTVGVICLTNRLPGARSEYFSRHDLEVLRTLADIIAPAIAQARSLERLAEFSAGQETGLCLIKKPRVPSTIFLSPVRLKNRMVISYANAEQKRDFDIKECQSICYKAYNHPWRQDEPCPWCPVVKIFQGARSAEGVTHSPTKANGFVRHYKVIASRYEDEFTKQEYALESIMDITDDVEMQDVLQQLASEQTPGDVFRCISEALGRTFQATDGLILSRRRDGWLIDARFSCSRHKTVKDGRRLLDALYKRARRGEDPLRAYMEERRSGQPHSFVFKDPPPRETTVDGETAAFLCGCTDGVRLLNIEHLPPRLLTAFPNPALVRFMVVPVPMQDPTAFIILGENGASRFFPALSNKKLEALRARAVALSFSDRVSRAAELALERIRHDEDFRKADGFVKSLLTFMGRPGRELDRFLIEQIPILLDADGCSLFELYPAIERNEHQQLRLKDTTGLYRPTGAPLSRDEVSQVFYMCDPREGLTAWVATCGLPVHVPAKYFVHKGNTSRLAPGFDRFFWHELDRLQAFLGREPASGRARLANFPTPVWSAEFNESSVRGHCYLAMPIPSPTGEVVGVVRVNGKRSPGIESFSDSDIRLLGACCSILGVVYAIRARASYSKAHMMLIAHHLSHYMTAIPKAEDILRDIQKLAVLDYRFERRTPASILNELFPKLSRRLKGRRVVFKRLRSRRLFKGKIAVDLDALENVFDELIENACKHAKVQEDKLRIKMGWLLQDDDRKKRVCFYVHDNGRSGVFRPPPRGRLHGIDIARDLLRHMGGKLQRSRNTAAGTRIEVTFPLNKEHTNGQET